VAKRVSIGPLTSNVFAPGNKIKRVLMGAILDDGVVKSELAVDRWFCKKKKEIR
jgi:cell division protein FtsI/penicillin-binding protein 2